MSGTPPYQHALATLLRLRRRIAHMPWAIWMRQSWQRTPKHPWFWPLLIACLGFAWLNYLFVTAPGAHIQGDGYYTYLWARSLVFDGDFDLGNDYRVCGDPWSLGHGKLHWPANHWSLGPTWLWAPFLLVAKYLLQRPEQAAEAAGCWGSYANTAVYTSVLAAWGAGLLVFRVARRYFSTAASVVAVCALWGATALPYYGSFLSSYAHAPAALITALIIERWDSYRRDNLGSRHAVVLGLLAGWAVTTRVSTICLSLMLAWVVGRHFYARWQRVRQDRAQRSRVIRRCMVFCSVAVLAAFMVCVPQMLVWKHTYGHWIVSPQGSHFMRWSRPNLIGVWFASTNGLLVWTPILYLGLIGICHGIFHRQYRQLFTPICIVVALSTYINASVWDYWGSAGYSGRRFTFVLPLLTLGIAYSCDKAFDWVERRPRLAAVAIASSLIVPLLFWNYAAMQGVFRGEIRSYREAPSPTFWRQTYRQMTDNIYDSMGNPLAWPASIPFALAYHSHPKHFDSLYGMGVFYLEHETQLPRPGEDLIDFNSPRQLQYLVHGFVFAPKPAGQVRIDSAKAEMLIPLFSDRVGAITINWKSGMKPNQRVKVFWNHQAVFSGQLPQRWTNSRVELRNAEVKQGINELRFKDAVDIQLRSIRIHDKRNSP